MSICMYIHICICVYVYIIHMYMYVLYLYKMFPLENSFKICHLCLVNWFLFFLNHLAYCLISITVVLNTCKTNELYFAHEYVCRYSFSEKVFILKLENGILFFSVLLYSNPYIDITHNFTDNLKIIL